MSRLRFAVFAPTLALAFLSACQDGPTAPTTGSLVVNVIGLPATVAADVQLTGPGGFSRTITRTDTLEGLAPGAYTLRTAALHALGALWVPPALEQAVTVTAGRAPQLAAVAYLLATGSVRISASGLPANVPAALTLSGPNGFTRAVAAGDTLRELVPGSYTLTAAVVTGGHHRYTSSAPVVANVPASLTPTELAATYAVSSAAITVSARGLPAGALMQATISQPGRPTTLLFAGDTAWGLEPGKYTVGYNSVVADNQTWAPDGAAEEVEVIASERPASSSMGYTVATGSLQLVATGLPEGSKPPLRVSDPVGNSIDVTTTTLYNLFPGEYSVRADTFTANGIGYQPVTATTKAAVVKGAVATVSIAYTVRGSTPPPASGPLNLTIDGVYLTQAVQRYDGGIPLVAGRAALLRVFVKANVANTVRPAVRVRLFDGAAPVATYTIAASATAVPTVIDQGLLNASWNVMVPKELVKPGLQVQAELDPTNLVAEGNEGDNAFPASGTPMALTVRAVPPVDVTFVPVLVTASGLQGAVTDASIADFMQSAMAVHPISSYTGVVRAPFTSTAAALDANDASGGWIRVLNEIQALRIADAGTRMYYGVVKVPYTSGVAGYGYVGYPAAIGWDYLPSGAAVLAHEIGHNFGRQHTPCGGPAGPDPRYPFPDGRTGIYGWSERRNTIILPSATDIMGYCGNQWISEYTYAGVMDFRGYLAGTATQASGSLVAASRANAGAALRVGTTEESSLLVWGRIRGGEITLEPSFELVTRTAVPARGSAYRLQGLDASGAELFSTTFDGDAVADAPAHDRTFAFALPMAASTRSRLVTLVVTGRDGARAEARVATSGDEPAVTVTRSGTGRATLRWDASRHPMLLVRDPATGKILSFARGGRATIAAPNAEVEVKAGNRLQGIARRARIQ